MQFLRINALYLDDADIASYSYIKFIYHACMVYEFYVAIASYICIIKIEGIDSQELHGTISLLRGYAGMFTVTL